MIVSDRKQFVFVHNPKAGGTTIRRHIEAFDDSCPPFWDFALNYRLRRKVDRAHIPLEDLQRGYPETYEKLKSYWSFVIVRNPYQRAVSAFAQRCMFRKKKKQLAHRAWALPAFRDYVRVLDARRVRRDVGWIHACPQKLFVTNRDEVVCDFIAKLETLDEDFRTVSARLDLGLAPPARRYTVSAARRGDGDPAAPGADPLLGVAHWYDVATAARIEAFYADDFTLFNYPQA